VALAASVVLGAAIAMAPADASAGIFSFTRTDYLLESYLFGLDSVAVADLDGQNGPDLIVASLTAGAGLGVVNVLLNNGDGTFAPAAGFDSCYGASNIVVGQFNPLTDNFLDVAMICGNQQEIGRMLGDGHGNFGAVQTVGVGYLSAASTGNPYVAIISFLRLGAMDGPTLVYGGYMAGIGNFTLCFLKVPDLEYDLEHGGANAPYCNIHINDIVGDPNFGQIDDWGPLAGDLAVGPYIENPDDPLNRDEAASFGSGFPLLPLAVTGYTPFYQSTWSYGARTSGTTAAAIALADVDGDGQVDVLMGGGSPTGGADPGTIAEFVPGWPIEQGASPTGSFSSISELYDMVTADFDGDGKLDIAALGEDDYEDDGVTVAIHRGNGDGTFDSYERFPAMGYSTTGGGEQMIAVGDFDRDGKPDLVTVGRYDKWASVLLNGAAAGCTACPVTATIGSAGGSLALPDGSVTVTVPPGAVAAPTLFSITDLATSAYGVGTPASLVGAVSLAPAGMGFAVPVELRFLWPDTAPDNGYVDNLGVDEETLRLYRNGVGITGQCRNGNVAYTPGVCTTACCDVVANTWTVQVSSFSEYALDAATCAAVEKPRLTLAKILPPSGDDTLTFTGAFTAPATPPDPDTHGLAITLEDAGGLLVEVTLPPGAWDKTTKTGWKVDKKRTRWTWAHPKDGDLGGFVRAVLVSRKGKLMLTLKGLAGSYMATAPVAIGVNLPANGECARAAFGTAGYACAVKNKGKTLLCK
jgi:FG-GAP-like repeat/ZU5 domain